eukprot:GGOE01010009.1.p4 GENE.GGOE01010009.1~~GGOE01010009.1.p4  ORF type:complete len:159 (-),score=29.26 GGOE01010009.1:1055-1531(-)
MVPDKPARVVDKLALDLHSDNSFCGRLGISSAKLLVFNVQFLEGTTKGGLQSPASCKLCGGFSREASLQSSNGLTSSFEMSDLERKLLEAEHQLQLERQTSLELESELQRWKGTANALSWQHRGSMESQGPASSGVGDGASGDGAPSRHLADCGCVVS